MIDQGLSPDLLRELDDAIDEQRLVRTLQELITLRSENPFGRAPSEGQGEGAVAGYLKDRFDKLRMTHEVREVTSGRPNLVGELAGAVGPASLMLAGHMDTARTVGYPDAYAAKVRDGRVHGRGACDMKGAIACFLEVVEVIRAVSPSIRGTLYVVGVADEEFGLTGAQEIGKNGPEVEGIIVGEPTGLEVCPASKGRVSTFVVTRGRAAHSSVPEAGVNAISHMGRVLGVFEGYSDELLGRGEPHPLLGFPRAMPGVISGGVQVNMVPDECRLEVDRRTLPGETKDGVYAELKALLEEAGDGIADFAAHLTEPSWFVPPNETPNDHPLVAALLAGAADVLGGRPEVCGFVAGSDAAYYGSPAVICGPGSIKQAHTTDEFVAIEELVMATRIYLRATLSLLRREPSEAKKGRERV